MSSVLRVGLVCEGTTDRIVINAAVAALLGDRDFSLIQLQPEDSLAFGRSGTGWPGVYHWCRQAGDQGAGSLRNNPVFESYDLLLLHVDADVSDYTYASGNIGTTATDLPCPRPCPPPSDTTEVLRDVILGWLGEALIPPNTVFCTPSKSTEAWVLAALFEADPNVTSGALECYPDPAAVLSTKPANLRLVRGGKKVVQRYQDRAGDIALNWTRVREVCSEAERFSTDFLAEVPIAA
jgi:hypothetical protein